MRRVMLFGLILLLGISFVSSQEETPSPTETPVPTIAPTQTHIPTSTSIPTDVPTETFTQTLTPIPTNTDIPTDIPSETPIVDNITSTQTESSSTIVPTLAATITSEPTLTPQTVEIISTTEPTAVVPPTMTPIPVQPSATPNNPPQERPLPQGAIQGFSAVQSFAVTSAIQIADGDTQGLITAIQNAAGTTTEIELAADGYYAVDSGPFSVFAPTGFPRIGMDTNITIHGNGSIIEATQSGYRLFGVWDGNLTLNNMTLRNATLGDNGGAAIVIVGSTATLNSVILEDNRVEGQTGEGRGIGGAVYSFFGNLNISNSEFRNNSAIKFGGAIFSWGSNVNISNTLFENNYAEQDGGAIGSRDSDVLNNNNVYVSNEAFNDGGAIHIEGSIWTETGSLFENNTANSGGAVHSISNPTIMVNQSNFIDNTFTTVGSDTSGTLNFDNNWWGLPQGPADGDIPFNATANNPSATPYAACQIFLGFDDDGDCLPNNFESSIPDLLTDQADSDFNGINDGDEDYDGDGLSNYGEYTFGTLPTVVDSDGDRLSDGDEVIIHGSDPGFEDSDDDLLPDGFEVIDAGTSPILTDTDNNGILDVFEDPDGDGIPHLFEYDYGYAPQQADSDNNGISDGDEDLDEDLLTNSQEIYFADGLVLFYDLDDPDSDFDGILDGDEDFDGDQLSNAIEFAVVDGQGTQIFDPRLFDTDNNGTSDSQEDTDGDGLTNIQELTLVNELDEPIYNLNLPDTDSNGVNDGDEDLDSDGLTNIQEFLTMLYEPQTSDTDNNGILDGNEDFDSDGLTNVQELILLNGLYDFIDSDSDNNGTLDGDEDLDSDGLTNTQELNLLDDQNQVVYELNLPDTDGNGTNDGDEDLDEDGLTNIQEFLTDLYNPALADTDSNGVNDGDEDFDSDGLTNAQELILLNGLYDFIDPDSDDNGTLDGDEDFDSDGLTNTQELNLLDDQNQVIYELTTADTDSNGTLDGDEDLDGDQLTNIQEFLTNLYDPVLVDSDSNGVLDGDEDFDVDGLSNIQELILLNGIYDFTDSDSDDNGVLDGDEDFDTDGLTNTQELNLLDDQNQIVYDLTMADTDSNGVLDGDEDFDVDGLTNAQEFFTNFYDPVLSDSDDNGVLDGDEDFDMDALSNVFELTLLDEQGQVIYLFSDSDSDDNGVLDGDEDLDSDGLTNSQETQLLDGQGTAIYDAQDDDSDSNGVLDGDEDLDSDGLTNAQEFASGIYDPQLADTDGNGTNDDDEDLDSDGLTNSQELSLVDGQNQVIYDFTDSDTDDNGILDGDEDLDGDNLTNAQEFVSGIYDPQLVDTDGNGTNDDDEDLDSDGLTNSQELSLVDGQNQVIYDFTDSDTDDNGVLDGDEDLDGDGLTNADEYTNQTDLFNPDSDADTLPDGFEVNLSQTNPNLVDSDSNGTDDPAEDPDGDNLTHYQEYLLGTDPLSPTTLGAPSRLRSETMSLPSSAVADGETPITLTTIVRDSQGRFLPNTPVVWSSNNPNFDITPVSGTTDASGVISTQVTSDQVTSGEVEVIAESVVVGRPVVSFIGGDARIVVRTSSPTNILAGQVAQVVFEVTNQGQLPLSNVDVIASLPIGRGVIESVTQDLLQGQGNNSAVWLIPTLNVGEIYQFEIQFRTSANLRLGQGARLNLEVSASEDVIASNNQTLRQFSIVDGYGALGGNQQTEKMSVQLTSSVTSAAVGESLQLLVTVENLSDEPIYNLIGDMPYLSQNIPNVPFTWGDPSRPGYLAPAGNGSASIATASIPFTMFANYPSGFNNSIIVRAIDSNSLDGSVVVNNDTLTTEELAIRGPNLTQSLTANPSSVSAGDEITFTLTVSNSAASDDTATNLGVIGNYISGTQPLNPIAPGGSQVLQFTHTATEDDIPKVVAWVQVTGTGQNEPDITIDLTSRRTVVVNPPSDPNNPTPTPDPADPIANLLIPDVDELPTFLPDRLVTLQLSIQNDGDTVAENTRLRVAVPIGVDVDPASLGIGVYNETTRFITWNYGTFQIGDVESVAPVFYVPANITIGTSLTFDVIASSTSIESTLDDNSQTIDVVIERPQPQDIALSAIGRNWLVGDNQDTISFQLTVFDQSGVPLANETATLTSDVGGVIFSPTSITTNVGGLATFDIQASESGTAVLTATVSNGETASITIQRRESALRIESSPDEIGVGGQDNYDLFIVNTATISGTNVASSDLIDLSVTVPPILDSSWFQFEQPTIPLGFGDFTTTQLTVSILPDNQLPDCTAIVGTHPLIISATGQTLGQIGQVETTLTITADPPSARNILPANGERMGGDNALFSWRSNTPATSTLYIRRQGETDYLPVVMDVDAIDPTLYSTSVTLLNDADGTIFEWYGTLTTGCGQRNIASPEQPNTFTRVETTTFVNSGYDFFVEDGYNLTQTVSGDPMLVNVRNDDNVSHTILVDVENPYDDLILGFIGSGSVDQVVALSPGQVLPLQLRVFTQETEQAEYPLTLRLENDLGEIDRIPLVVRVKQPLVDVGIEILSVDDRTLITTARLTNNGDTLTDLTLDVVQAGTGIPANVLIQPDIQHTYLVAGQSLDIAFIPLDIADSDVAASSPQTFDPIANVALSAEPQLQAINGPFDITLKARDFFLPNLIPTGGVLNNSCGADGSGRTVAAECTVPGGTDTRIVNAWYCTNRPDIDIPVSLSLPNGGFGVPITRVEVGANFSRGFTGETVYNHSTTLSLNSSIVDSAFVPQTSSIRQEVPPETLVLDGVAPIQLLNLRSEHANNTHYTVASGFTVEIDYGEHTRTGCFTQQEIDDAQGATLTCNGSFLNDVPDTELALTFEVDPAVAATIPNGNTFVVGDTIPMVATLLNNGQQDILDPITLSIEVPKGLTASSFQAVNEEAPTDILGVVQEILNQLRELFDDDDSTLNITETDDAILVEYTYTDGLKPLEPEVVTFNLDVKASTVGEFTLVGSVSIPNDLNNDTAVAFNSSIGPTLLSNNGGGDDVRQTITQEINVELCESLNELLCSLQILKLADNVSPTLGSSINFSIQLQYPIADSGDEPVNIENVAVIDQLPANLGFISSSFTKNGMPDDSQSYDVQSGIWTVGTLQPEDVAEIQISTKLTELVDGEFTNTAIVQGATGLESTVTMSMSSITCLANFSNDFNTYETPDTSTAVATMNALNINNPIEIVGFTRNTNGELWYLIGRSYHKDFPRLRFDWAIDSDSFILEQSGECNNLPLLTPTGSLTPGIIPPGVDITNACLLIPNDEFEVVTLEYIKDFTNGNENPEDMPITLQQYYPVLVTQLHLNKQYVKVRYVNSSSNVNDEYWLKLKDIGVTLQSECFNQTDIEIPTLEESLLPQCDMTDLDDPTTLTQFLNCRPAYPTSSPKVFNGEEAFILNDFQSTSGGCNNTIKECWVEYPHSGPPCPLYRDEDVVDEEDNRNCGIDLQTAEDAVADEEGNKAVYAYAGGQIQQFIPESGTLRIITTDLNGNTSNRYNYTHLALASGFVYKPTEYIASGILLGSYGPYGAYGSRRVEDEEHLDSVQIIAEDSYSEPPWN